MTQEPTAPLKNTLLKVVIGLLLIWIVYQLAPVLPPFICAAIFAYILNPLVVKLSAVRIKQWHLSRTMSSGVILSTVLLMIAGLGIILVPVLKHEAQVLQNRLPSLLAHVNTVWLPWVNTHLGQTIKLDMQTLQDWLSSVSLGESLIQQTMTAFKTGGAAILGFVGNLLLSIVLCFYFLSDWPELMRRLKTLVPNRARQLLDTVVTQSDQVLGQYLRGQIAVMLALSAYYCSALYLVGFDVALPVGLITGLLVVIPYIGYALGLVLAIIAALLQFDLNNGLLWVVIIYGFGQALESFILTPKWVGSSLGLHPAAVIFALLAFGQLLGFAGVLLALPMAAICVVIGKLILNRYQHSDWYKELH